MRTFNHQSNNAINISGAVAQPEESLSGNSGFYQPAKNPQNLRVVPPPNKSFRERPENSLLSVMSEPLYQKLLPILELVTLPAQEYLYRAGDPVKYLYFPESAVISEFRMIEDGRIIETVMAGGEGLVGLSASLSAGAAGSWTEVLIAGSALRIRADRWRAGFEGSHELQTVSFDYLIRYINQISQRSICHSFHSVRQRFCSWLMMLGRRRSYLKIPLTHELIARSLGVHRPSISQIARELQNNRVIEYRRGNISILDARALEMAACDCHRQIDL